MRTTEHQLSTRSFLQGVSLREGGLLTLLLFLLTRPYIGIQHDARLYVGYALAKIDPQGIGQDLVFTADGQSGYSIFPPIFLQIVKWLGPETAAMVVPIVGLVVWFLVYRLFLDEVLPVSWTAVQRNAAVLIAIAMSPYYGGTGVLRFAEPYATPRIFAELLVLLALALLLRGSRWSAGSLALAAIVHPLMTAPGIGVAIWTQVRSKHWRLALLGAAVTAVAVLLGRSLMTTTNTGAFGRFDKEWLNVLNFKGSLVFVRHWNLQDFTRTLLHVVTIGMAWRQLRDELRRLTGAVLVASAFGVAVTLIGADVVGHVLLTQAQLWRGMWLLALLATLCVPVLIHRAWEPARATERGIELRRSATLLLILAWVIVEISPNAGPIGLVALALWEAPARWPALSLPPIGLRLIATVVSLLLVSVLCAQVWVATGVAWSSPDLTMRWNWNYWLLTGLPMAVLLSMSIGSLLGNSRVVTLRELALLTSAVLALVILRFDSRTRYQRYVESALGGYVRTGESLIPRGNGPVIWPYADLEPWAFAGSPSWGSITQGIPAVFSRELSLEWYARWQFLEDNGFVAKGEGAIALVADRAMPRTVLCPLGGSEPGRIVYPTAVHGFKLTTPQLIQPTKMGRPWWGFSLVNVRHCLTDRIVELEAAAILRSTAPGTPSHNDPETRVLNTRSFRHSR